MLRNYRVLYLRSFCLLFFLTFKTADWMEEH